MKITFYFISIILIGSINNQPTPETDFTIFPEDISGAENTSFFEEIESNEKFYGAYYFGSSETSLTDARSGLRFSSKNNVNLNSNIEN